MTNGISRRYSFRMLVLATTATAALAAMEPAMSATLDATIKSAPRADTIQTSEGVVEIYAVHHASLVLSVKGKHIFVDPAPLEEKSNAIAEYKALPKPDVIIYTHSHYDHFNAGVLEAIVTPETEIVAPADVAAQTPAGLRARVKVMGYGDKTTVLGYALEAVAMYNTTPAHAKFHPKGFGNGYVLAIGGKRIYIAGDTEQTPENAHIPAIDVAFVPVNQPYTLTVEGAAAWLKDFHPRVVYPYHFRNADGSFSDLAALKKDAGTASDVRLLRWY